MCMCIHGILHIIFKYKQLQIAEEVAGEVDFYQFIQIMWLIHIMERSNKFVKYVKCGFRNKRLSCVGTAHGWELASCHLLFVGS